ncbi:MAG: DUF4493 domain-containing protein [Prevotellaceae bacterium]|nr:DUF4493 domain-containing protein [Prevotellaceae bacterium]
MARLTFTSMGCLLGLFLLAAACSSSQEEALAGGGAGGSVKISISANADFGALTKAVNESEYENTDNYTVQILNSAGGVATDMDGTACDYTGADLPKTIELKNGTYTAKAFYGTEHDYATTEFYVEGSYPFNINGGEVTSNISITCEPTCGKISTEFSDDMADYFSDYYVVYGVASTGASIYWDKDAADPYYVKVDEAGEDITATIHFTRMADNLSSTIERTYNLQRNKAWKLIIEPDVSSGDLGISITIDTTVNEQDIEIVVPAEWI